MQLYTEIAIGTPGNRNQFIKIEDLPKYFKQVNKDGTYQELYTNYYRFDKTLITHISKYKSIKGFDGMCYLNKILLDIDRGSQTHDVVLDNTREFVNDICFGLDIPEDWVIPWYSGSGYHIVLPNIFQFKGSADLPRIVKNTLSHHFPKADNIYDKPRLIRAPYSINNKTGLMKIPLTHDELFKLSSKDIMELASKKGTLEEMFRANVPMSPPVVNKQIIEPIVISKEKATKVLNRGSELSNAIVTPNQIAPCVQSLYMNGPRSGNRRNVLLRIISYYRRNGLPYSAAQAIAQDWSSQGEGFDREEAIEVTDYIYTNDRKYTCMDELMDMNCKQSCIYYASKKKGNDPLIPVYTADQLNQMYFKQLKERKDYPGINLKEIFGMETDYWVRPQELVVLTGDTGTGKTGFIQNIILNTKGKVSWFSMEFKLGLLFRRFRQITEKENKKDVDSSYEPILEQEALLKQELQSGQISPKEADEKYVALMSSLPEISDNLKRMTYSNASPNIAGLKRVVGEDMPNILVIDKIDCIKGNHYGGNEKAKVDEIIAGLRDICENMNMIVIAVAHIPKSESDRIRQTGGSLHKHSGMGSAAIGQKADHMWGLDGPDNGTFRRFYIAKGRDQNKFTKAFNFDFNTFNLKEVELEEHTLQF